MLNNTFFSTLRPDNVGKFQHYNDRFMAQPTPSAPAYEPPTFQMPSTSSDTTPQPFISEPRRPAVIIVERRPSWASSYFSGFFDALWFTRPQHTTVVVNHPAPNRTMFFGLNSSNSRADDKKDDKAEIAQAGLLAAVLVFTALIAVAGIGIAYSYSEIKKIAENLVAKRKPLTNAIKLGWATFLGYAGLKIGIHLGAYYGPALFGTAAMGSFFGGILLATGTMAAGIVVGKYFAKLVQYIHTRGKSTNSDPYTLLPSYAEAVDKTFSNRSPYQASRANLMKGYIVNKLEIAHDLKAPKAWLDNLEGFKKQLKSGEVSQDLRNYLDSEFTLIRNAWYQAKFTAQQDARFTSPELSRIEHELKALAVITNQEGLLQQDIQYAHSVLNPTPQYPQYPHTGYTGQQQQTVYPDLHSVPPVYQPYAEHQSNTAHGASEMYDPFASQSPQSGWTPPTVRH